MSFWVTKNPAHCADAGLGRQVSRRIFSIPNFVFYAIADGLFFICAKSTLSFSLLLRKKHKVPLLSLDYDSCFGKIKIDHIGYNTYNNYINYISGRDVLG